MTVKHVGPQDRVYPHAKNTQKIDARKAVFSTPFITFTPEERDVLALLCEEYVTQGGHIRGVNTEAVSSAFAKLEASKDA